MERRNWSDKGAVAAKSVYFSTTQSFLISLLITCNEKNFVFRGPKLFVLFVYQREKKWKYVHKAKYWIGILIRRRKLVEVFVITESEVESKYVREKGREDSYEGKKLWIVDKSTQNNVKIKENCAKLM